MAPSPQVQRRAREFQGRRPNINDLPDEMRRNYNKYVQPMSCDTTGALKAWDHPTDEELIDLWNSWCGKGGEHDISLTDFHNDSLFNVVKRLVSVLLSESTEHKC